MNALAAEAPVRGGVDRTPPRPQERFHTLDAMRGLGAIGVVCLHIHMWLGPFTVPRGYLAVDFFLALSGLVIAHAYGRKFDQGLGLGRFVLVRLVRLYPLYALGTVIGIALTLLAMRFGNMARPAALPFAMTIGASLAMLPNPLPAAAAGWEPRGWLMPFDTPTWSLVFEMLVNILLAAIWRRLTTTTLVALVLVSGAALLVEAIRYGSIDVGVDWATAGLALPRMLFAFLLGVLVQRLPRPASRQSWLAWVLPLVLFATFLPPAGPGPAYDLACVMLVYPALLVLGSFIEPARTLLFRILGVTSFAVYVLSEPLQSGTGVLLRHVPWLAPRLGFAMGMAFVVLVVAAAWLADALFDMPARRWLGGWLLGRRRPSGIAING